MFYKGCSEIFLLVFRILLLFFLVIAYGCIATNESNKLQFGESVKICLHMAHFSKSSSSLILNLI